MGPVDFRRREDALRAANRSRRGNWWFFRARDRRGSTSSPRRGERGRTSAWRIILLAAVIALALRTFVVEAYRIPSRSMEQTLLPGDFLLVNKLAYGAEVPVWRHRLPAWRPPQRNDLVVFDWPVDPSVAFVKRLVGLPGDTVAMTAGVLLRNGAPQQEAWALRGAAGDGSEDVPRNDWGPLVVPPRHYFVLGDNRDNSLDSRAWGFVPDSLVRGTPWIVYFSFEPDSAARAPWLTRIRWPRLGTSVR